MARPVVGAVLAPLVLVVAILIVAHVFDERSPAAGT